MKNVFNFRLLSLLWTLSIVSVLFSCEDETTKEDIPNPQNHKPVARAGADKEITLPIHTVVLEGTAEDEDGDIASTIWFQKSGPSVALMNGQHELFVTLIQLKEGTYEFMFTVTDKKGNTTTDEVKVIVKPEENENNPLGSRLSKIVHSANDMQLFEYDAFGKVVKYTSQWQYVQNDPTKVKSIVYQIEYDNEDKITEINITGGTKIKYYYNNGILEKTEELNPLGTLKKRITYTFGNGKLLEETIEEGLHTSVVYFKKTYLYNHIGNLTTITTLTKSSANAVYEPYTTVEYHGFDYNKRVDDFLMHTPFLKGVGFHRTNPTKKVFKLANGTTQSTENYVYQYYENGLPSKIFKTIINSDVTVSLEAQFIYQ